jgi:hypothetical protein
MYILKHYDLFHLVSLSLNKGKVHPRTSDEDPEGEHRYSSTLSLTLAPEEGWWSTPCPGRSTPEKETRYPLCRRLGGPLGWSGQVRKISSMPEFDHRTVQPLARRCSGPPLSFSTVIIFVLYWCIQTIANIIAIYNCFD